MGYQPPQRGQHSAFPSPTGQPRTSKSGDRRSLGTIKCSMEIGSKMLVMKENYRPLELVFVRHGESEGNVANNAAHGGDTSYFTDEFRSRHNSSWNLTPDGEKQAVAAGKWITQNVNCGIFDTYYVSSYRRAKRTAGLMNLPGAKWLIRDYIREHDWGYLGMMADEERAIKYPEIMKKRDINPYYFTAPGGESLADVVIRARVGIMQTLYRIIPNKRGVVVTHGNLMWPIRIIMEGILPEDYLKMKEGNDPRNKMDHCQILHYTRIDPFTGRVTKTFNWMRSVCPWDPNPEIDSWRPIPHKKHTNEELSNS